MVLSEKLCKRLASSCINDDQLFHELKTNHIKKGDVGTQVSGFLLANHESAHFVEHHYKARHIYIITQ